MGREPKTDGYLVFSQHELARNEWTSRIWNNGRVAYIKETEVRFRPKKSGSNYLQVCNRSGMIPMFFKNGKPVNLKPGEGPWKVRLKLIVERV